METKVRQTKWDGGKINKQKKVGRERVETKVRQKKWDGRLKIKIKIKSRMGKKWDGNKSGMEKVG